jgi:hypothetical protein
VFENRVLRRIFGHKRDEVTGAQRKLCRAVRSHDFIICVLHQMLLG